MHHAIVLHTGDISVRMRPGLGPMRAGAKPTGPIFTMRVGAIADISTEPPCHRAPLSLNPWNDRRLISTGATTVRARHPGRTFLLVNMPMCAGVEDPQCLGGIATVAYSRVRVLPAAP